VSVAPEKDTLAIYSFMFPRWSGDTRPGPTSGETARLPLAETPCPSCTSILDSLDGAAPHLGARIYQIPILNVFVRDGGQFRHSWATELVFAAREPDEDPRHVDSIWPIWNVLDMTPGGRGTDWDFPHIDYG
jgi:predicted dithiol-disulfide oxidoreductase (DUF899 family)